MLQLDNVVRSFGALRAVDDVTLSVKQGTITGLIGPNGAGKTTLFNTIAGSLQADSGSIQLGGQRIDGLRPDQVFHRGLGRTFQIPRPLGALTVLENMLLAPVAQAGERFWNSWLARGTIRAQDARNRDKANEVLAFVNLSHLAERPARVLSGGQQKLLELARILMVDPSIILLDEPAAGVNPVLLQSLIERIAALHQRGVTFLLIEHNMDVVMQLCNPVVVMAQGKLVMQGTPQQVHSDARVIDAYLGDQP